MAVEDGDGEKIHPMNGAGEELPPVDEGWQAWKFVVGAWFVEALGWGFPASYGIFQAYYFQNAPFAGSRALPTVGLLAIGMAFLGLPFVTPIGLRFPAYQVHLMWAGWLVCFLSLVAASFATQVWHLLLTQGFTYGVGWVMCYMPQSVMLNEWFVKKRGLVYGILYGSSGVTGIVMPFALEKLLQAYGFRFTLRSYACVFLLLSGPGLMLCGPRIPKRKGAVKPERADFSFLRWPMFYVFAAQVLFQGFAAYIPNVLLDQFAQELGLSSTQAALLVTLLGVAQAAGQIVLGGLSDRLSVFVPTTLSCGVAGISVFALWGPATSMAQLSAFTVVYSFFAGAYSVLWPSMLMYLTDETGTYFSIYSIFALERGIGNLAAGPISALLIGQTIDVEAYGIGKYRGVIVAAGGVMLLAATSGTGYFIRRAFEQYQRLPGSDDEADQAGAAGHSRAQSHELSDLEAS